MNSNGQGKYYSVLTRAEIREKMMKQVAHISELFSLSLSDATVVLIRLRWDSFKVQELLGDDNQKFLSEIGLVGSPSVDFEVAGEGNNLVSTPCCSHKFTRECWRDYLRESLVKNKNKNKKKKDEEVLLLSCLSPDCVASVGPSTIEKLEEPAKEIYGRYLLESFMESKKDSIKWCPDPDCDYAIKRLDIDDPSEDFGVVCLCSHIFCWSCQLESHRPVTCNNASLWLNELLEESRTLAPIAERIKHCPKCYRLVENHDGVWKCNPCNASSPSNELALITHLALWEASQAEMEKSKRDLEAKLSTRLTADCGLGELDMVALREAWMLIVQCILVLKWSCVFGYFITDYHSAKKVYLEYQVEIATANLSIHKKTLDDVTDRVISGGDVIAFRQILGDTRTRTGNYFQSFAKSVEDGLRDIEVTAYEDGTNDYWFCDRCTYKNYSFERQCRVCVGPCESPRHFQGETNPWEKRNSSGLAITIPLRFCLSLFPKLPDPILPPSSPRKGKCPEPDCDYAVERREDHHPSQDFDVCWSCQLEPHRPVTCDNASLWLNNLLEESRTLARITERITHCPECHTPVENQDRVWKCIQCKASSPSKESALISHVALWDACLEEIQTSEKDMEKDITGLTTSSDLGELDIKALREAWILIVQCRRLLKWSCVFGYFISDYHSAKKEYLDHLWKDATAHLLKHKETLDEVMYRVISGGDITALRQILGDTTTRTGNYFDFFLKTLEYGLCDVKVGAYEDVTTDYWFCDRCTYKNDSGVQDCRICSVAIESPPHVAHGNSNNSASAHRQGGTNPSESEDE